MRSLVWIGGLAAAGVLTGCNLFTSYDCTLELRPAVSVEARDSVTGRLITDSTTGYVRDGAYLDILQPTFFDPTGTLQWRGAAHERPGTYTVYLSRRGYRDWSQAGIRVRGGDCHVETVRVTARMQPGQ